MKKFIKPSVCFIFITCLCIVVLSYISITLAEHVNQDVRYVGMQECEACHPEHVETYSEWKYSRNFRILEMRGRDHDPECLPCHTTGYGLPGGFISVEETPQMKNIQCETCHGPASLHLKAPTKEEHQRTLNIPKNICTKCHRQHKHMGY